MKGGVLLMDSEGGGVMLMDSEGGGGGNVDG